MLWCNDPQREAKSLKTELEEAFSQVLQTDSYVLGAAYKRFVRELAGYLGTGHCIGVASGTDALILALKALELEPGAEVILPAHTAPPTAVAVHLAGLTPVFTDIDADSMCLDPDGLTGLVTDATKAVIVVHLYGFPAPLSRLADFCRDKGLTLIEDCAQSLGASRKGKQTGTTAAMGCFSFYPTKTLAALGDGGAVVTDDPLLAGRIEQMRQYGWDEDRICQTEGMNSRLDELQAAFLSVKLRHLDARRRRREEIAKDYAGRFAHLPVICPAVDEGGIHAYHQFVIRTGQRDQLNRFLHDRGIGSAILYQTPLHRHPAFKHCRHGDLKVTEQVVDEILSLPVHPDMGPDEVDAVSEAVIGFFGQ